MADTKITRLRNLLTPFRNYFALLEEQENEPSLVMQDKMQVYLDAEKERIFKMQAEVWDIIAEIPNEACDGKNADLKNANCAIFDVSGSLPGNIKELLQECEYRLQQAIDIFNGSAGLNTGKEDKYMKMVECVEKIQALGNDR